MKNLLLLLAATLAVSASAQTFSAKVERNGKIPLAKTIVFTDTALQDWQPFQLTTNEQPWNDEDYIAEKETVDKWRKQHLAGAYARTGAPRSTTALQPVMQNNFVANNAQGTPNDNHMAISDSGLVVSVVNTNIRVYNDTGLQLYTKGLAAFANTLGVLQNVSDPRVLYDPQTDRFIVIFFSGVVSSTSRVVVGFSKTNNPTGAWNFYKLSGNYLGDTTWSDYPIVTLSDKDLFVTFNQLQDNSDWRTGFRYSICWQVDKARGYAGDTLQFNYWHHFEYNGQPVWNVCPVQGGSQPAGPETYLLSVRSYDLSNDTVFLHTISNSYQSGNAQYSIKALTTNTPYGLPPTALQKDGQYLATNDARILSAFYENGKIQYVQNTVNTATVSSGVYAGEVNNPASANAQATGQIIAYDSIDLGYPSIAYIGNGPFDNRAIITCSFSQRDSFPGTAAFYKDAAGNISDLLPVKYGLRAVDILGDTVERWGDYTGVQRKYNEPNTAWLAGSWANNFNNYSTWIAKVVNPDSAVVSSIKNTSTNTAVTVFPNPSAETFSIKMEFPEDNYIQFALYDINGKQVRILLEDNFKAGEGIFSFNTQYLANGMYLLKISNRGRLIQTEKVIVKR